MKGKRGCPSARPIRLPAVQRNEADREEGSPSVVVRLLTWNGCLSLSGGLASPNLGCCSILLLQGFLFQHVLALSCFLTSRHRTGLLEGATAHQLEGLLALTAFAVTDLQGDCLG